MTCMHEVEAAGCETYFQIPPPYTRAVILTSGILLITCAFFGFFAHHEEIAASLQFDSSKPKASYDSVFLLWAKISNVDCDFITAPGMRRDFKSPHVHKVARVLRD